MIENVIRHISKVGQIPSFSTFEERLHPYLRSVFGNISESREIEVKGNNLLFRIGENPDKPLIALAAHLDKINHYGKDYPSPLPVERTGEYLEGAMDDSAGLGLMLAIAETASAHQWPDLLFFFSEMEESKGLKEHPELLRNKGRGYTHGMGARRIAECCLRKDIIPEEVITLDTTPLFEGASGIALYSRHWELNKLDPSPELIEKTEQSMGRFIRIEPAIKVDNNTNDYLHYGEVFNMNSEKPVVSVALEPAIYPYHQRGERVFITDIERIFAIVTTYLDSYPS